MKSGHKIQNHHFVLYITEMKLKSIQVVVWETSDYPKGKTFQRSCDDSLFVFQVPTFAYEKRLSRIETLRLAITYIAFMGELLGIEPSSPKPEYIPREYYLPNWVPSLSATIDSPDQVFKMISDWSSPIHKDETLVLKSSLPISIRIL